MFRRKRHDASPDELARDDLRRLMLDSEDFMWLMVGSNYPELRINKLRPLYKQYRAIGGGWGTSKSRNEDA